MDTVSAVLSTLALNAAWQMVAVVAAGLALLAWANAERNDRPARARLAMKMRRPR